MTGRLLVAALLVGLGLAACSSASLVPSDDAGAEGGSAPDAAASPTTLPKQAPYVVDTSAIDPSYSIYDHGKDCFDRFRVEVPSFDCDGPQSSRLKIEVDGKEVTTGVPARCDKPGMVGTSFACVPGARVTKFSQVNEFGDTIVTLFLCRRSSPSALDSGRFDNIALVQSNLRSNEACWYQIRKDAAFVGRKLASPYAVGRIKGDAADRAATELYESPLTLTSDHSECYKCHDSQLWLRTPWLAKANQIAALSGNDNEVPHGTGAPYYLGKAYRDWNLAAQQPARVRIDAAALDAAFPPSAADRAAITAGRMAPSDACTQCHALGKSAEAGDAQGTCNDFARLWMTDKGSDYGSTSNGLRLSTFGNSFPNNAWMPPGAAQQFQTQDAYRSFYRRAFAAIEHCCDDPTRKGCGAQP